MKNGWCAWSWLLLCNTLVQQFVLFDQSERAAGMKWNCCWCRKYELIFTAVAALDGQSGDGGKARNGMRRGQGAGSPPPTRRLCFHLRPSAGLSKYYRKDYHGTWEDGVGGRGGTCSGSGGRSQKKNVLTYWRYATFFCIFLDFPENNSWILMRNNQVCLREWYLQDGAAPNNIFVNLNVVSQMGLLGLVPLHFLMEQ